MVNNDILGYLQKEAISVLGSTLAQQLPAQFEAIFNVRTDPRQRIQLGQLHTSGSMKEFGQGTERPQTNPFVGGITTLEALQYGEAIGYGLVTLEDAKAKGWDLLQLIENWAASWSTSRNKLAANVIKNGGTGTGYDGQALFSTAHPQRSKYLDGATISNTDATSEAIAAAMMKTFHSNFADVMGVAENGERITHQPSHCIVVSTADMHEAIAVLRSPQIAGTNNNDINTLVSLGIEVVYWPQVAQASGQEYIYFAQARGGLEFVDKEALNIDAWYEPETREYRVGPAFQAVAGYRDFRAISRKAKT